jgi:hypothetical protein
MKSVLLLAAMAVCGAAFAQCTGCKGKPSADDAFLAEANRMMAMSEGKTACCKSTAGALKIKGEAGCCNAQGEPAKFKVWVRNEGYKMFGCEGSAAKGRSALMAEGKKVGGVQPVTGRVTL